MLDKMCIDLIKTHSRDNPITSVTMERLLHLTGREIRNYVRVARRSGIPIGSNENGYFLCATPEELQETLADLHSRSIDMFETEAALQTTLKNLKGQGSLI